MYKKLHLSILIILLTIAVLGCTVTLPWRIERQEPTPTPPPPPTPIVIVVTPTETHMQMPTASPTPTQAPPQAPAVTEEPAIALEAQVKAVYDEAMLKRLD